MDTEKNKPFVYWEVHGYAECESGEREETNLLTTNESLAREFARILIDGGCTSVCFDMVESFERLCL